MSLNDPHRHKGSRLRCAARFNDDAGTWYADLITIGRGEPNEAGGNSSPLSGVRRRCRCFECPSRAQEPGRIYRLGILTGAARQAPRMVAFFDQLKVLGFVEGQNLKIVAGGFDLREAQFADVAATLAKSRPRRRCPTRRRTPRPRHCPRPISRESLFIVRRAARSARAQHTRGPMCSTTSREATTDSSRFSATST